MHLVMKELSTWLFMIGALGSISLLASTWNIEILNEMLIVYKRGKERGLVDLLGEKIMLSGSTHKILKIKYVSIMVAIEPVISYSGEASNYMPVMLRKIN